MIQLILLSGGSGKRLWPLSNESRSKQFLKVLSSPNGERESMVQRVLRQVDEAGLECNVTLATNSGQRDIIINQLGDSVSIVDEPLRRDTFPAIALSTASLFLNKKCSPDEIVVVMPCDPYTESGYFTTIAKMAKLVEERVANLVLMGIKPTYPSSKFGYIVPQSETISGQTDEQKGVESALTWQKVDRFTEKPDTQTATQLLAQGAYWNGGVFAFRLGYLMDIISKYIKVSSFEELYSRYAELPKISFDYEVVEKESSSVVVTFDGSWKDLGTWNTLSEELNSPIIGNGFLGNDARKTHIINELQIPIFCDGIQDAIIAASYDGILVTSKEASENLKSYVPLFNDRPLYEERRWGRYVVMGKSSYSDGFKSLTKTLQLTAGKSISYQIHQHRCEVWSFVDGEGLLALDGKIRKVGRGDVVVVNKGQGHALKALTELQLIEVQTGEILEESDITRFPWEWPEISQ